MLSFPPRGCTSPSISRSVLLSCLFRLGVVQVRQFPEAYCLVVFSASGSYKSVNFRKRIAYLSFPPRGRTGPSISGSVLLTCLFRLGVVQVRQFPEVHCLVVLFFRLGVVPVRLPFVQKAFARQISKVAAVSNGRVGHLCNKVS